MKNPFVATTDRRAETVTVTVRQKHWDKALRSKAAPSASCPLAQAVREKFPRRKIGVGNYTVMTGDINYSMNKKGTDLTYAFDTKREVRLPREVVLRRMA